MLFEFLNELSDKFGLSLEGTALRFVLSCSVDKAPQEYEAHLASLLSASGRINHNADGKSRKTR